MNTKKEPGTFVISLDFELFWGMTDKTTLKQYGENILGVRKAIPRMLELFSKYDIHATWATVGMLAFTSKQELIQSLPIRKPNYGNQKLSNYVYLETANVGENEHQDPYHFGGSLITLIQAVPHQEIGTHSFSHYYCREEGQTAETFSEDLSASLTALAPYTPRITSLVLPRNQWNETYIPICKEHGIKAFRGNQKSFIYQARTEELQVNPFIRALRLLDQYLPLTGSNTYTKEDVKKSMPRNVAASMFLRPYMPLLRLFEPLRKLRIQNAMTHAAKKGELFHLWWHPHNFGKHTEENLATLESILKHYSVLRKKHAMQSMTMEECSEKL